MLKKILSCCFLLGCIMLWVPGWGQELDTSFSSSFVSTDAVPYSTVVQSDGKIVVVGVGLLLANNRPCGKVVRFNPDGTLDEEFSQKLLNSQGNIASVRLLPGNKLLLMDSYDLSTYEPFSINGVHYSRMAVLNADGSVDKGFKMSAIDGGNIIADVEPQIDGKIIIAGKFTSVGFKNLGNIVRLLPNGDVDYDFNTQIGFDKSTSLINIQKDGKILVYGLFSSYQGVRRNKIARLNSDGTLDADFNPGDKILNNIYVTDINTQIKGKILVKYFDFSSQLHKMMMLNDDGSLDSSFSVTLERKNGMYDRKVVGVNTLPYGFDENSIVVTDDNSILVNTKSNSFGGLVKLAANGQKDSKFAVNQNSGVTSFALNADGSIVVVGQLDNGGGISVLQSSGEKKQDFNARLRDIGWIGSMLQQKDGKILIGGDFTEVGGASYKYMARLNTDGSVDNTFAFNAIDKPINNLALSSDDKIIALGDFTVSTGSGIARFNSSGILDYTFKFSGPQAMGIYGRAVLQRPDGRLLVGGYTKKIYISDDPVIMLLNSDGSINKSFSVRESVLGNNTVTDMKWQSDGKIIFCAKNLYDYTYPASVGRLLSDGTLDPTFKLSNRIEKIKANEINVDKDDKILIIGEIKLLTNSNIRSVVRLKRDGEIDDERFGEVYNYSVYTARTQPNGRILLGGRKEYNNLLKRECSIFRLMHDGVIDESFSDPGIRRTVGTILLQADGKILLGGTMYSVGKTPICGVFRLNAQEVLANVSAVAPNAAVWPVPADDYLIVSLDERRGAASIQMVDQLGRIILTHSISGGRVRLPLSTVKSGIYLIKITCEKGSFSRKIMVQHDR